MSRRKRQPEQFDVVEFLRESDGDLKSALNSLLWSQSAAPAHANEAHSAGPGLNLIPGAGDDNADTGCSRYSSNDNVDHAITSGAGINLTSEAYLGPGPELTAKPRYGDIGDTLPLQAGMAIAPKLDPDLNIISGIDLTSSQPLISRPSIDTGPGINLIPPPDLTIHDSGQSPNAPAYEPKKRQFPIREMKLAQDAHTRAEQQVYEYLWQNARVLDEVSRTITIGFGAMARIVRLSESNARINVRSLIAKLAIEEFGDYNCEQSVGRTYRILNYSEILKRRRGAGLLWYMRRTLAVVFVDPNTGQPLDLGLKRTQPGKVRPGPNLSTGRGINSTPDPHPKLAAKPGINLGPHYREEERETDFRETTSASSDSLLFEALSQYGVVDDDVLKRLRAETRRVCPDFTEEELVHFIHSKGHLIRRRDSGISSPIGFLLTSVPKCFAGEAFQLFRKSREREAVEKGQQQAEFENWCREQQAILDDPNASEEDKKWARKLLHDDNSS